MANLTDPAKSIERIYNEEIREIPYPVFMRCFDQLFVNPPQTDPAEPAAELKQHFKAVCMAAERGVADSEGRGDDRIREFYEHVFPVWKESLSEEEFKKYQDIIDGKLTEAKRQEAQKLETGFFEDDAEVIDCDEDLDDGAGDMHSRFEKAMQAALKEEDIREQRQKKAGGAEAADAGAVERQKTSATGDADGSGESCGGQEENGAPDLQSVKYLAKAVSEGKLPLRYTDMKDKTPLATYRFDDQKVAVRLVKSPRSCYLSLTCPVSYIHRDDSDQRIIALASRLGYNEVKENEYKLDGRNYSLRLKFGGQSTYLACRTEAELSPKTFAKALNELHKHLQETVEEFKAKKESGG